MDESKLLDKLKSKLAAKSTPKKSLEIDVEGDNSGDTADDCYQMLIDGVKADDKEAVKEALFMCFDEYSNK